MKFRTALLAVPAIVALPFTASPAMAEDASYSIELESLNDSGATGIALLVLDGNDLTVTIESDGLVPGQPHAQHIHGMPTLDVDYMCPTSADDANGDGIVTTSEGVPSYGEVTIALTTEGDMSADSGVAVDRMPLADEAGSLRYERTFAIDDEFVDNIRNLHIVQHGIDVNDNDQYDMDGAGPSDLNPELPGEATHPATCGMVEGASVGAVPSGGVQTGAGTTSGVESPTGLVLGGAALLSAAGFAVAVRRRRSER